MSTSISITLPPMARLQALYRITRDDLPLAENLIGGRPRILPYMAEEAETLLACTTLLDPDDPEAAQWLRLLCRAYTLEAARSIPGDGPVQLELPVFGPSSAPRLDGQIAMGLRQYTDACHAALALRDEEAWTLLAQVPLEAMGPGAPPHIALQASSLRAYLGGDARTAAALAVKALVACNDEGLEPRVLDHALFVVSPEVELFTSWDQPQEEWESAVMEAINLHRRYALGMAGGEEPPPTSFVMLGALAFAAMRHAAGLPASPRAYELPEGLVWRSYEGIASTARVGNGASPP